MMYVCYCFVVVCNWSIEKGKDTRNLTDLCEATFTKDSALPQISSQDQLLWRQVVRFSVFELRKIAGRCDQKLSRSPLQSLQRSVTVLDNGCDRQTFILPRRLSYPRCKVNIFHSVFTPSFDLSSRWLWQRDGSKPQNFPDLNQTKPHRTVVKETAAHWLSKDLKERCK